MEAEGRKFEPEPEDGILGLEGELMVEFVADGIRDLMGEVEGARPKEGAGRVLLGWAVVWDAGGWGLGGGVRTIMMSLTQTIDITGRV